MKFLMTVKSFHPLCSLPSFKLLSEASMILGQLKFWMNSKGPPMGMDPPHLCPIKTYYDLLINACVRYDKTKKANIGKRRNVYIGKAANIMFKWNGRLGRSHMNPSPSLLLMTQLPVQHMPKRMTFLL